LRCGHDRRHQVQPVKERAMSNRTINRRGMFGRLAAVPLAVGVAASAQGGQKRGAPAAAPPAGKRTFAPPLSGRETVRRRYFPDVELVTSEGDKVRFYDDLIKDKIVILNLMYAKCDGVCPITTSNLKAVRKILSRDVDHDIFIYSMTVKPEQDSPAALKDYARVHGVSDPRWLFLTGKPADVDLLR